MRHASEDKTLARALQGLIDEVFPTGENKAVQVDFSSSDAPGNGPGAGAAWLKWIVKTVRVADGCIVILSENSVGAPWLTWEAGAVTGVALSSAATTVADWDERVIPLLFGVAVDRIPAPLQHSQAVDGEDPAALTGLLHRLHALSGSSTRFDDVKAAERAKAFVSEIRDAVHASVLERLPRLRLPEQTSLRFMNCFSRLVMQPTDGAIGNSIRIRCSRFAGDAYQQWRFVPVGKGVYRIATVDLAKCLSVQDDSTRENKPIILWDYEEGNDSQHWRVRFGAGAENTLDTVRIVNCRSGLCLTAPDDGYVTQTTFENYRNQDWWLIAAPVGKFE